PAAMLEGSGVALEFSERAPGLFEATLTASAEEEVRILAGLEGAPRNLRTRLVSTMGDVVRPEKQIDPEAGLDLGRLARATGGQVLPSNASPPPARTDQPSLGLALLWP